MAGRRPTPRSPFVERLSSLVTRSGRVEVARPMAPEERQRQAREVRRRVIRRVAIVALLLALLDVVWIGSRALAARGHLVKAKKLVAQAQDEVRAGHIQNALTLASKVQHEAAAADNDSSDPIWNLTSSLPVFGPTLSNISGIASAVDEVSGQILPQLALAAEDIRGTKLRRPDGSINVAALTDAGSKLQVAQAALAASESRVAALPHAQVLPTVGDARNQLLTQISSLRTEFVGAATATKLAPAMLGATSTRTYFLALENSAEARGSGGIIGGYGVAKIDDGKLQPLTQAGGDSTFPAYGEPTVPLPADEDERWGGFGPSEDLRNANISPNFPWAVDNIAGLVKRHFGESIDGVIALDPTAAGYIVSATGPITLPDGTVITGANLTKYVESDLYVKYNEANIAVGRSDRQKALTQVTQAIFGAISRGQGDPVALLAALGRADGEGRLLIGSTHPDEEALLTTTLAGGQIPTSTAPYSEVALVNSSGDKLDYYLDRTVSWVAGDCSGPTRTSTVMATLTNNAPASGLPGYVTGAQTVAGTGPDGRTIFRGDPGSALLPPYTLGEYVSVYGTVGATVSNVSVDGTSVNYVTQTERNHPVVSLYLSLPPQGGRHTVEVRWMEPTAPGTPLLRVQPLVRPQTSSVAVRACS